MRYVTLSTAKDAREAAKELFDKEIEGKKIKTSIRQQTLINIYNSILKMHNKKNDEMQKRRQQKEGGSGSNPDKETSEELNKNKDKEAKAEKNGIIVIISYCVEFSAMFRAPHISDRAKKQIRPRINSENFPKLPNSDSVPTGYTGAYTKYTTKDLIQIF